ncbi:MAG: dipeptidase [Thermoguttaceae bacterium]|nr:dipeptidase [Thermoguttaceae bacterium]MDW8080109.1 dipeptidase [Thermoguttaceae bacterium]
MRNIEKFIRDNVPRFEEVLCDFLRIPSVSADPRHREDMVRAAEWLRKYLEGIGLDAEVIRPPGSVPAGHPLVYAESEAVPGAPTILVYGHYDVQPADPLEEWSSPPFEPTRRDGYLVARGASDDKGQLLTHVFSTEAWLAVYGKLPVKLKFLFEGEEEIGSATLSAYLRQDPDRLACDCIVISDTAQFSPGQPAITYALRGIAYFQLELEGPKTDLHSGQYGGAVTNPANALVMMLGALVDERGRVAIPGFYEAVRPISEEERQMLGLLPFDEDVFFERLGVDGGSGEAGFTVLERLWVRPSFDISGLTAGYQGAGAKTIIPSRATAKFSFRLVPDQDPKKIALLAEEYLRKICPPGIRMKLALLAQCPALALSLRSPWVDAARRAIEAGFGCPPVFVRSGGSIPIINQLYQSLRAYVLLVGWGQESDNAHGPNERFSLADFHRGIRTSCHLWQELANVEVKDSE